MTSHVPPEVYALSLLTALLWGFSPILEKRGMVGGGTPLQGSIVVVFVDTLMFWGGLMLLSGGDGLFEGVSLEIIALFLVAGVIGTALGRLSLYVGVDHVGASVNNAVTSTRPLFASAFALVWLGEVVTLQMAVGIFLIVFGLLVLALSRGGDIGGWSYWELVFPLIAACAFAGGNVLRRFGLSTAPVSALEAVALNETAGLVVLVGYAVARKQHDLLSLPRRTYALFTVSGVLTGIALLSLFEALARGPVTVVDPLYGTAPLFTTLFAYFLLRNVERITPRMVAGAVLVVLGAGLITAV